MEQDLPNVRGQRKCPCCASHKPLGELMCPECRHREGETPSRVARVMLKHAEAIIGQRRD